MSDEKKLTEEELDAKGVKYLSLTEWVKGGVGMVNRQFLGPLHPESYEQHWIRKYGSLAEFPYEVIYGPVDPDYKESCPCCGQLVHPWIMDNYLKYKIHSAVIEQYDYNEEAYGEVNDISKKRSF